MDPNKLTGLNEYNSLSDNSPPGQTDTTWVGLAVVAIIIIIAIIF